jgi:serine/threonine protein kinase
VLQKINDHVFKNTEALITNKVTVSNYLKSANSKYKQITFIETKTNAFYFKDQDNNYWNMMLFIPDSITHNIAIASDLVFEAGLLYGDFITQTQLVPSDEIVEILPDFHSIPKRLEQFDEALKSASEVTKTSAKAQIDFVLQHREDMSQLSALKSKNHFPIRITHNDAKLSNILFDKNNKGLAVIDLDTVMPGIVHFDFGDSIRSICTTAKEDETNLDLVNLNLEFYNAYCKGFAQSTKALLTKEEIAYLPLGAKTIVFIMGLRFLTDYLNNNIYYKTDYETHNLVRAKNQFKLVESIYDNYEAIKKMTQDAFK